jgi:hypothetical protein
MLPPEVKTVVRPVSFILKKPATEYYPPRVKFNPWEFFPKYKTVSSGLSVTVSNRKLYCTQRSDNY